MSEVIAEISLDALSHNWQLIRAKAENCKVVAMIKADAYGHGSLELAKHFESLPYKPDAFGVARLSEAKTLRQNNISTEIILIEGVGTAQELESAAKLGLQLVIHQLWQLDLIEAFCKRAGHAYPARLWLKVDTGMHRLGLRPEELTQARQQLERWAQSGLAMQTGLMTHFACSDEPDNAYTQQQLACFEQCAQEFTDGDLECSLANSAAILAWPETHKQWVRPGIALYGASPFAAQSAADLGLLPVMTLKAKVIAVRELKAFEAVGYGSSWTSDNNTLLGVVAIGYGDGYPRHAPSGTPVLIAGKYYPLAGRVSMDMIVVDLGSDSEVSVGEQAILWGQGLPIELIADASGTISYELLCCVTNRVAFKYV